MTPQAYRARLDRLSHLIKLAGLEALVLTKLANMREKKGRVSDMSITELYLTAYYLAVYFPLVIVGVALVVITCGISAVGRRHAG